MLSILGEEVGRNTAAVGESLTVLIDGNALGDNVVSDMEGKVDGTEDNSEEGEFVGKYVGTIGAKNQWTHGVRWTSSKV